MTGLHQLADRVLAVDRHQLVAQPIVGRMQRHRERDVGYLLQPVHRRHDASGADGNPALAEGIAEVVAHHINRGDDGVEIKQWLAHAHHHHVGNALRITFGQQAVMGKMQLGDDFGSRQIAIETLLGCRAEAAVQRATQLR